MKRMNAVLPASPGLRMRLIGLALAFVAEKTLLSHFVDFDRAQAAEGFGAAIRILQHWGFRFLVTLAVTLMLFAYVHGGENLRIATNAMRRSGIRSSWLLVHLLLVACLIPPSYLMYRPEATSVPFAVVVTMGLTLGAMAAASALLAAAPWSLWLKAARALGILWPYALVTAGIAAMAMQWGQRLWTVTAALTFDLVRLSLVPFVPTLRADSATHVISTERFAVEISEICSGLEGMSLMLVFVTAWLVYFRREYVFPRALLLIPLGLTLVFALNVLRIALLVLIGHAGYPEVAQYGFHSQAGWIAFNAVCCALVFISRRSPLLNRAAPAAGEATDMHNPTATYLAPLLAILAAGTLSHALSGRFETLYPLRLIAAVAALYTLRHRLVALPWRCSWRGPVVGASIFLLWLTAARLLLRPITEPAELASMQPLLRTVWIASHCLTSIALVPLAEELAYRGYLMRRLTIAEFESVPYQSVRWPALFITAVAFGAAHGALWLPGIITGVAYGLLVTHRGSLAEAVTAHATTNALIAVAVVAGDQWQLW